MQLIIQIKRLKSSFDDNCNIIFNSADCGLFGTCCSVCFLAHHTKRQSKTQNKNANAKLKAWVHIRTQTFGSKPKKEAFVVCARSNTERDAKTLLFTIVSGPKKGGVGAGDQVREIGP